MYRSKKKKGESMNIKNIDMFLTIKKFSKLTFNQDFQVDVITLYKIKKNMKKFDEAYRPCDEAIQEILKTKNADNEKDIEAKINTLMQEKVDVDIEKIKISAFDGAKSSFDFIDAIYIMIED